MQLSKSVVIGAAVAMVAMVGVIAFLLGRESGRHHAAPTPVAYVQPAAGAPAPATIPSLTGPSPYTPTPPPEPQPTPRTPAPPPPLAAAPTRSPAGAPATESLDEAAQVHQYFLTVDEIQAGPSGDPSEMANKLLTAQMSGDSSGFDSLITGANDMLKRAHAVSPPEACRGYHEKLLRLLEQSAALLVQLKPAISKGDMASLSAIMPQANSLQTQTTQLESEGRALKKRFGL